MENSGKKILVAVDGSDQSLFAVRYAGRMAPPDSKIVLFHVFNKIPDVFWDMEGEYPFREHLIRVGAWETKQKKVMERFMETAMSDLADAGIPEKDVRCNIHERNVGIARDIIAESKRGYDAVVLGRTGLNKLKDLVLGSVANKLMARLTHVPTWIVGADPEPNRLLVAVDASEQSRKIMDYLGSFIRHRDFHVTLIHVIRGFQKPTPQPEDLSELDTLYKEFSNSAYEEMNKILDGYKDHLMEACHNSALVKTRIVTGAPSRAGEIVSVAEEESCGSIVVGRRGLSRIEEFFMGRVSNKVVNIAKDKAVWVVA